MIYSLTVLDFDDSKICGAAAANSPLRAQTVRLLWRRCIKNHGKIDSNVRRINHTPRLADSMKDD
jgi:hypothetical protein